MQLLQYSRTLLLMTLPPLSTRSSSCPSPDLNHLFTPSGMERNSRRATSWTNDVWSSTTLFSSIQTQIRCSPEGRVNFAYPLQVACYISPLDYFSSSTTFIAYVTLYFTAPRDIYLFSQVIPDVFGSVVYHIAVVKFQVSPLFGYAVFIT